MPSGCKDKILVVIPTFNNAGTLEQVVLSAKQEHPHVLVVNDGSSDGTREILARLNGVYVVTHENNGGKGAAVLSAFDFARNRGFQSIVTMDADGQHLGSDLPKIIEAAAEHPERIIIGVRDMEQGENIPESSKFGRAFSNFWVWAEAGVKLQDTQSGFRAYPVRESIFMALKCSKYDFEIEILVKALWQGVRAEEIPIQVYYPERTSRVSHFRPWMDNFRLSLLHSGLVATRLFRFLLPLESSPDQGEGEETPGAGIMAWLVSKLGRKICFLILPFPLMYFYFLSGNSRRAIAKMYEQVGRRSAFSNVFLNFWYFALSLIDRLSIKDVKVVKQDLSGTSHRMYRPGSILIGAHYGDWMMSSVAISKQKDTSFAILMDEDGSPKFQEKLRQMDLGKVHLLNAKKAGPSIVLDIKQILDEGGCVSFLGDRILPGNESLQVSFLGRPAHFPLAPYKVAKILKAPIYFFYSYRVHGGLQGRYFADIEPIWDGEEEATAEQLAERFVARLERLVKAKPQHWFNFFDFWRHEQAKVAG
ncbi:MAG: glycosyltransferase [Oligoflexales bacterium]